MNDAARRTVLTAGVLVLTVIGAWEWHRTFGWSAVGWRLVGAAVLAVVVSGAGILAGRGRPAWWSPLLSLVALIWYLAVAATRTTVAGILPGASTLHAVAVGLVDGWARILAVPLPDPASAHLLVLPVAAVWLSALFGTEIVARTRPAMLGVVPPLAGYVLAILFGIGGTGSRVIPSALFVVVVLIMGLVPARRVVISTAGLRARRAAESVACVAAVAALAAVLGPRLPLVSSGQPYDPRSVPQAPPGSTPVLDPLAEISQWAQQPKMTLLTVTTPYDVSLRLAVMTRYSATGGWGAATSFEPIASRLPSARTAQPSPAPTVAVTERIHVTGLTGPYLPAAELPIRIQGVAALADPSTATLIAADGSATGATYTVTSAAPSRQPDCSLDAAAPPAAPLASLPSDIVDEALAFTARATSPCVRAEDIQHALLTRYKFSATAPSGTNIEIIRNFLAGAKGTSEQFAASFALLGQAVGLPTRVVVGFHAGQQQPDGTWVTAGDAYAWPEVDFAGIGWMTFNPTPTSITSSTTVVTPKATAVTPNQATSTPTPSTVPPIETSAPPARPHRHASSSLRDVAIGLGAAAALVAVVFLAVRSTRSTRRRRRREAADSRDRVIGAWLESVDSLAAAGLRRNSAATVTQVAADGGRTVPEAQGDLMVLSDLVNRTVYSGAAAEPSTVDDAWRLEARIGAQSRRQARMRARAVKALDLRVLGGRD